jgi:hypothetical protein
MNTKVESKSSILSATLEEYFGEKMNLARIKFFGLFICALCKVQTVCFERIATNFESSVNVGSSPRRIQCFMSDYLLDTDLIASKVKNKQVVPELQVIASFNKPDGTQTLYNERWQIDSEFKTLKTSGLYIEDTHLTELDRVNQLFALVLIAFVWAYKIGIYLNELCPIKIKKHGRKAKSIFKFVLTYLSKTLFSNDIDKYYECCIFLSCT